MEAPGPIPLDLSASIVDNRGGRYAVLENKARLRT